MKDNRRNIIYYSLNNLSDNKKIWIENIPHLYNDYEIIFDTSSRSLFDRACLKWIINGIIDKNIGKIIVYDKLEFDSITNYNHIAWLCRNCKVNIKSLNVL